MPLPPQNVRKAQKNTQGLISRWEQKQVELALQNETETIPDLADPTKNWTRQDMGTYLLITDPDGNTYKIEKDKDIGQQIQDALDQHLTWGNIFKLGLLGLGGAIFIGGIKIQREVQKP
jgi:hypothetical protein